MKKNAYIIGRQYGRNAEAFRAIRNFCARSTWAHVENYFTNQIDNGCVEIDYVGINYATKKSKK